jgi:hypothetical protein
LALVKEIAHLGVPDEFGYDSAMNLREDIESNGFTVVRNVFAPDEIRRLRDILTNHLGRRGARLQLGKTQPNAASEVPQLDFLFAHLKVVELFKQALGDVVFTGHCDIHMNMVSGWHKDSGETAGGYFQGDYFGSDDCRVYKIAIYLQDAGSKGGLTVRSGSHRVPKLGTGEVVRLDTRAGDVVLFDVRLDHTGQLPDPIEQGMKAVSRLASGGKRGPDPAAITALHKLYWRLLGRQDRLSVFFTFGAPNAFTYQFAEANMARQLRQAGGKARLLDSIATPLREQGVTVYGAH